MMGKSNKIITHMSEYSDNIRVESRARIQIRQKSRAERIRDKNIVYP